jgi:hypothetical protein
MMVYVTAPPTSCDECPRNRARRARVSYRMEGKRSLKLINQLRHVDYRRRQAAEADVPTATGRPRAGDDAER